MKTSKPFSTISYNSLDHLQAVLSDLVNRRVLYFWIFIKHHREEDESKDHVHLLLVPNGQVDTDAVLRQLEEFDPCNPTKPFRCLSPRKTNSFGDWYYYALHDERYLISHGSQARKYHYSKDDFFYSSEDEYQEYVHSIDHRRLFKSNAVFDALNEGKSLYDMLREGIVTQNNYLQASKLVKDFFQKPSDLLMRKGCSHTPLIDPETGEVYENEQ